MADRLSNLDDTVLGSILSRVLTEDVLTAWLVSRRFRNLHTTLDIFDFYIPAEAGVVQTIWLLNFVRWAFYVHILPTLNTFSLHSFGQYPEDLASTSRINTYVSQALAKQLENLEVNVHNLHRPVRLPLRLFTTTSWCKLVLHGCLVLDSRSNTHLPLLKIIRLSLVDFVSVNSLRNLVDHSPQPETLTIELYSHSLTTLTIHYCLAHNLYLNVDASNLRSFNYNCLTVETCEYNFGEMPHLNAAYLDARPFSLGSHVGLRHIVGQVRHVSKLKASRHILEFTMDMLPQFQNLRKFVTEGFIPSQNEMLLAFMRRAPNLEHLVIKVALLADAGERVEIDLNQDAPYCCDLDLMFVDIGGFLNSENEIDLLALLVNNSHNLDNVRLTLHQSIRDKENIVEDVAAALGTFPKANKSCELVIL